MTNSKNLTIDGIFISVEENKELTILEAAKKVGVIIPTLCSCKDLNIKGNCRVCMVEQEGRGLVPACSTLVSDGMKIETSSTTALQYRRNVVELILADHNRNCPGCEANKTCTLQKVADGLNIVEEDFEEVFLHKEKQQFRSTLVINRNRCIKCGRCKAICEEKSHRNAVGILNRGWKEEFFIDFGNCNACGKCTEVCPVGCLNLDRHLDRTWNYLDTYNGIKTVVFTSNNLDMLKEDAFGKFGNESELACAFLRKIGFQKILFATMTGGKDAEANANDLIKKLYLSNADNPQKIVVITEDRSWKHLAETLTPISAVLLPEDLHMMLEQSLYDIQHLG